MSDTLDGYTVYVLHRSSPYREAFTAALSTIGSVCTKITGPSDFASGDRCLALICVDDPDSWRTLSRIAGCTAMYTVALVPEEANSATRAVKCGANSVISMHVPVDTILNTARLTVLGMSVVPQQLVKEAAPLCAEHDTPMPLREEHLDLLRQLVSGVSKQELAASRFVSARTLNRKLSEVHRLLNVTNDLQAICTVVRRGYL